MVVAAGPDGVGVTPGPAAARGRSGVGGLGLLLGLRVQPLGQGGDCGEATHDRLQVLGELPAWRDVFFALDSCQRGSRVPIRRSEILAEM